MHKLSQSVLGYICKHDLLRAGNRVGVAVSGGADSVAVLRMLLELRSELGIVLWVVHLNHKLRDADSDDDEQFVRDIAAAHSLPLICECADVRAYAMKKRLSLETAARELRYQFFSRVLSEANLDKISTAHTLDDQAETVLLKLTRGAGTRGLAGIYPKISNQHSAVSIQPGKAIIRPLLATRRSEVEAYLREISQTWREDASNRELRHTRNRLRHEILPRLAEQVNPRVRESLAEAAEIARCEEEYWSQEMARLLPQLSRTNGNARSLSHAQLAALQPAVQRRVVRAFGECFGLNLEFRHVQEILGLIQEGASAALPDGWSVVLSEGKVRFHRNKSHEAQNYEYELTVPGKFLIPEANITIEASLVCKEASQHDNQALLDKRLTAGGLLVRNWRPGDRFWPSHRKSPKKIKELLQDLHVIGRRKQNWPVIACGNEVVWVRDLGVRRDCQARHGQGVLILASDLESA